MPDVAESVHSGFGWSRWVGLPQTAPCNTNSKCTVQSKGLLRKRMQYLGRQRHDSRRRL